MKKIVPLMFFTLIIASYATLVASAQVDENPYVWIYDEYGHTRDEFLLGEKLRIVAYDSHTPYTVKLYDSDGMLRKYWLSDTPHFDSGLLDDVTDKLGPWLVEVRDLICKFAVGTYNVIPEVAFGILGALAACFTGFGIKSLRAKRKL